MRGGGSRGSLFAALSQQLTGNATLDDWLRSTPSDANSYGTPVIAPSDPAPRSTDNGPNADTPTPDAPTAHADDA
ncbi:MAG TPA: hypothetical protein VFN78_00290 [Ktedonobacterales bacterium]|nr:hypothetical protein [Ktedonobacterales bacterium]